MNKTNTLVRVMEGIYRSHDGSVRVFKRRWQDKANPWVVCYTNLFGSRVEKRYPRLDMIRAAMKDGSL